MNSINTLSLVLTTTLPVVVLSQHHHGGQEEYKPSKNSPGDDPGHNAHQETLIFACLGAVVVMAILIIILLWFFVDRTKDTVRLIERLLPDIVEWMKSEENGGGTGPGHLSGTFDAKNEFEAGFKGSVDFIDATGDRVKLTSYSKKEDTVTTIVDDTVGSTGLTSYTKKLNNGDMPRYQNDKAATRLPTYTKMDHHQQVRSAVEIDGPMSARQTTSTTQITADVSVVQAKAQPIRSGLSGGGYLSATPSPHVTAYSPDHISGHANPPSRVTTRHDGHNRRRQKHAASVSSPPVTPTDPEKAALRNGGEVILAYWEPPAYTAYDNQALSIDKRATLPVTTPPCSPEGKDNGSEEDINLKKKRRASFYVESHV